MLKFKEEIKQFTFTWDKGGEEECSFTLRQPSPRDLTTIMEANTTHVWDAPTGIPKKKREQLLRRYEKMNHEGFMDDKIDFLITAWAVHDDNGKPWPCTRENKILFDKSRPDITSWLFEKLDEQAEGEKEQGDKEIKN
jgi:hypothetical protein